MNPRHILAVMAAALMPATVAAQDAGQEYQAALSDLVVEDDRSDRILEGLIWYPSEATGPLQLDFRSDVWVGSEVVRNGAAANGAFPLIVLSHGMFGNARNMAWFAAELAQRGYVVAAIEHPGTSTWSRDPDQRRALWDRSGDISRLIDFSTGLGALPVEIDPEAVFMAGHSLGGFTALSLAGARYDAERWERFCDGIPDELVCRIFSDWNIAKTPEDRERMEDDLSDDRIRAFAVFDLGGTQSFTEESLGRIGRPLLIFGAPIMNSGLTLDIESRALIQSLPTGRIHYVEPPSLTHFDFFDMCQPNGIEFLAREEPGDEIVCMDGGAHRAEMHELIVDEVTAFFAAVAE